MTLELFYKCDALAFCLPCWIVAAGKKRHPFEFKDLESYLRFQKYPCFNPEKNYKSKSSCSGAKLKFVLKNKIGCYNEARCWFMQLTCSWKAFQYCVFYSKKLEVKSYKTCKLWLLLNIFLASINFSDFDDKSKSSWSEVKYKTRIKICPKLLALIGNNILE